MAAAIGSGTSSKLRIFDIQPSPGSCPFVHRAKIVMKEKNLAYDTSYVDKADKNKDGFLDIFRTIVSNPEHRGTTPVLIDGDVKLAESDIVSEYLDHKYDSGTKMFPADPYQLALVRLFVTNFDNEVRAAAGQILRAATKQEYDDKTAKLPSSLKILDTFLATYGGKGGYFLGSSFSWAEAATLPFFYRMEKWLAAYRNIEIDEVLKQHNFTHLQEWKKAGFTRPSFANTLAGDDVIVDGGSVICSVPFEDLK